MRSTSFAARLMRAMRQHPKTILFAFGISCSALWTPLELSLAFFPNLNVHGWLKFGVFLSLSASSGLIWALARIVPASVRLVIPGIKTTVKIETGDLLDYEAHKVVAVNEFFDSQLGHCVSPHSLHGQCITKLFNGNSARFEEDIDKSLSSYANEVITREHSNRRKRYEIGTIAVTSHGKYCLFFPAISHTDVTTLKAYADADCLWKTLRQLWKSVRIHSNGVPVAVPLMGAGLSHIKLNYQDLLNLILLSIVSESNDSGEICSEITIVLSDEAYEHVNLGSITKGW